MEEGEGRGMLVSVGDRCPWGALCRFGASGKCRGEHTLPEMKHFAMRREIQQADARTSCAFCVQGCCQFGDGCRLGMRGDSDYGDSEDGREDEWVGSGEECDRRMTNARSVGMKAQVRLQVRW